MPGPGREIDGDGRQRKIIVDAGIAVSGNRVVATHPLELVKCEVANIVGRGVQKSNRAEVGGIVDIIELRASNQLNGPQRTTGPGSPVTMRQRRRSTAVTAPGSRKLVYETKS